MNKRLNIDFFAICVLLLTLGGTIVAFACIQVSSNDLWCHALHGRILIEQGRFPVFSDYSFVAGEDATMHKINWLPGLLFHCLIHWWGYYGIIAFKLAGLLVICTSITLSLREYKISWSWCALAVPCFMLVSWWRFMPRGDFVNMVMLAIYLYILTRHQQRQDRSIWLLPLLQVIWIQFHYLACLGIFAIMVYALGKPYARRLIGVAVGCLVLSFANIGTYHKVFYPLRALWEMDSNRKALYNFVLEYRPLIAVSVQNSSWIIVAIAFLLFSLVNFGRGKKIAAWGSFAAAAVFAQLALDVSWDVLFLPAILVILLTLLVLLGNFPQISLAHVVIFGTFALFALKFKRFGGLLGVAIVPILFLYTWQLLRARIQVTANWCRYALYGVAVGINILLAVLVASNFVFARLVFLDRCRLQWSQVKMPVRAVKFLERQRIGGNIYTHYNIGGFVGYHIYPRGKIFIHSLSFWYSQRHFQLFRRMSYAQIDPELLASSYSIDTMLLMIKAARNRPIWQQLHDSPHWYLAYLDEVSAIYVRRNSGPGKKLARFMIDLHQFSIDDSQIFFPYGFHWLGNFFYSLHHWQQAEICYRRALASPIFRDQAYLRLGMIALRYRDRSTALEHFLAAAKIKPTKQLMYHLENLLDQLLPPEKKVDSYWQAMAIYLRWKSEREFLNN